MSEKTMEEILAGIDPAQVLNESTQRTTSIWAQIQQGIDSVPLAKEYSKKKLVGFGAGGLTAVAASLVAIFVVGSTSTSAVAAILNSASQKSSPQVALASLDPGQYYYQQNNFVQICMVGSPNMGPNEPLISYEAHATIQSWTRQDGSGKIVVTPTPIGQGGSHFSSLADEQRWIALGRPYIPCALGDASNQIAGNPANANPIRGYPGNTFTLSMYGGFGINIPSMPVTQALAAATKVNNLPENPQLITSLLSNGQIDVNGSVAQTPQSCPVQFEANRTTTGCSIREQLSILQQLLVIPDGSSKLGSSLYEVLAQFPGAELAGSVTLPNGESGTAVTIHTDQTSTFQVTMESKSGSLTSCSEIQPVNGVLERVAEVDFGSVKVVNGIGSVS